MKIKNVLLVNDNSQECDKIDRLLRDMFPDVSVRVATNGREALDCLMGVLDSAEDMRMNPDVMIISDSISDLTPTEICNVVSSYYRFRHIKFYLLADPAKIQPEASDRALFSGYMNRPLGNDHDARSKFLQLQPDPGSGNKQLAFLPFLGIIKAKLLSASGSVTVGMKAAACIACISTAAVVVPAMRESNVKKETAPVHETAAHSDEFPQVEIAAPPVEVILPVENELALEVPVYEAVTEEESAVVPEVISAVENPQPEKDTIVPKKTFSIGVKKADRSRP